MTTRLVADLARMEVCLCIIQLTYKLFDYTGSGLPILCSLPGEMAELLVREQAGYFVPPENAGALAERVEWLSKNGGVVDRLSINARRVAEKYGDAKIVYGRMSTFLEEVAASR